MGDRISQPKMLPNNLTKHIILLGPSFFPIVIIMKCLSRVDAFGSHWKLQSKYSSKGKLMQQQKVAFEEISCYQKRQARI